MKCFYGILSLGLCLALAVTSAEARDNSSESIALKNQSGQAALIVPLSVKPISIHDGAEKVEEMIWMRGISGSTTPVESEVTVDESTSTFTVTCVFEGEEYPDFYIYRPGMFKGTVWDDEADMSDRYSFEVPAGMYDIASRYYSEKEGMEGFAYIVHENVEVHADMTVMFSHDELTEKLSLRPLLMSGEEMRLPEVTWLDEAPWYTVDYSNANSENVYYEYMLFREGCQAIGLGASQANVEEMEEPSDLTVLTNKLSDKYYLLTFCSVMTYEEGQQLSTTEIRSLSTRLEHTYHANFREFTFPQFVNTPLHDELGVEKNNTCVTGCMWVDNVQMAGCSVYTPELCPKVFVAAQPSEVVDVKLVVRPVRVEVENTMHFEAEDEDGNKFSWSDVLLLEMAGLPAWFHDDEWEYINQNHSECGYYSYQCPIEGPMFEYPGVEPYCFTAKSIQAPFGNSCPLLVIGTQIQDEEEGRIVGILPEAWIGRYGEVRNADKWVTDITVKNEQDEQLFFNREDGVIEGWLYDYFTSAHTPQKLQFAFVNDNVLIDADLFGCNTTLVEIDETKDDNCTPTPQMLIFKNTSGAITDRFNSASEGVIEFSAGDFNWFDDGDRWGYTVEEADVLVEYAPYGEETWQPIEVEEVPEYFYMPGFGYFYRGSLACVDQPSANGWYDLRMTLTDKAGNRTVEHISPAFKIGEGAGVKSTPVDGIAVWVADGRVRTNCADAVSLELFTLDGRLVARSAGSTMAVDGLKGALLVRLTTASGAVTTHKLLL